MDGIMRKLEELREERTFRNLFSIMCGNGDKVAAEYQEEGVIKS